jgi:hypothetical protein
LDALGGGGVEITSTARRGERFSEHDPPSGMEAAVEAAVQCWIHGASPPRAVDGAEAEVVCHVVGEDALGN